MTCLDLFYLRYLETVEVSLIISKTILLKVYPFSTYAKYTEKLSFLGGKIKGSQGIIHFVHTQNFPKN